MSPTLTIDADSAPGAWACAISHTPHLAAQVSEFTRRASPLSLSRAGEAEALPPAFSVSPDLSGRAS